MFRLMIADDEDEERRGIRFLLDKYGFEFEIAEAADGAKALKALEEFPADILLTDVKMPFLSGLELAAEVREQYPDMQIIFFSGYDDFEYVKQALSLQAVDYILKPVNPLEFQKIFHLVLERLEQAQEQVESQSLARQNRIALTRNYVLARLLNQVPYEKIAIEYGEDQLSFLKEYTRLILVEFEEDVFGNAIPDPKLFAKKLGRNLPCEFDFLDLTPSQGVFLLKQFSCEDSRLKELARCMYRMSEKEFGQNCYLAVGKAILRVQDISMVYREAEDSLEERFFYQDIHVYPVDREAGQEAIAGRNDAQLLQMIDKDVSCHDIYSLKRDMGALLELCRNNGFQSYIYTRFVCANLLKVLVQGLPGGGERLAGLVEQIYSCVSFSDLEDVLWSVEQELEETYCQTEDTSKRTIAMVEKYIREHYDEPLSLDMLAEKVYLTPHYLSSMFAQEKGTGINKYIKNVRMERARELLRDTNMKISDICVQVGYANLSYFCRCFRNEFGVTPEQYRR